MYPVILRHDEKATRVPVEAVDDARTVRLAARQTPGHQRIHEGAGGMPWSRVDDQARGFVDHQQPKVFVRHAQGDVLGFDPARSGLDPHGHDLPWGQAKAPRPHDSVDGHRSPVYELRRP
jgi:hypothetical protein